MFFKNLCDLVLWKKVFSALEGLNDQVLRLDPSLDKQPQIFWSKVLAYLYLSDFVLNM